MGDERTQIYSEYSTYYMYNELILNWLKK